MRRRRCGRRAACAASGCTAGTRSPASPPSARASRNCARACLRTCSAGGGREGSLFCFYLTLNLMMAVLSFSQTAATSLDAPLGRAVHAVADGHVVCADALRDGAGGAAHAEEPARNLQCALLSKADCLNVRAQTGSLKGKETGCVSLEQKVTSSTETAQCVHAARKSLESYCEASRTGSSSSPVTASSRQGTGKSSLGTPPGLRRSPRASHTIWTPGLSQEPAKGRLSHFTRSDQQAPQLGMPCMRRKSAHLFGTP